MNVAAGWALFTRLGEAQILLPAMAAALLWLARQAPGRRLAGRWLAATAGAALVTTASKVAFIGWGLGHASLDYTGISGHAMFAAAVLPVLAGVLAGGAIGPGAGRAVGAGMVVAALIAVSRVVTGAHSVADVVLGFTLGGLAAALVLRDRSPVLTAAPGRLAAGLAAWFLVLPFVAPDPRTHEWVTALSLAVSGRDQPYTLQQLRRSQPPAAPPRSGGLPQHRPPA